MIIVVLILLTGVAQASDWPMFQHDARHTGYTDENIPDDLKLLWSYETGDWVYSSPAVVDGKVFVGGSDDNKIYCFGETTPTIMPILTPILEPTLKPTPSPVPTLIDSDDDGVPDRYDYNPYDPDIQSWRDIKTPGFEAILAIVGLLAISYLLGRR